MKKAIVFIFLTISFLQIGFSQTEDRWQKQMEEFQRRMQEMTEQLSKQFGGSSFQFDTTFVMPFDSSFMRSFEFHFDRNALDTSMIKGFRWYGSDEMPMQMDTLFFKEFKNFDGENFPGLQFDSEWSQQLSEMMERMMKQLEGFGQEFDENGQQYYFREWKSTPDDQNKEQPKPAPKPAPQKKRKTTII